MKLTEREIERMYIFVGAEMARKRLTKGIKLNYPESVALITDEVKDGIRAGMTLPEAARYGTTILSRKDVMEGVADMIDKVQMEANFVDGTKLVTIHNPIRNP